MSFFVSFTSSYVYQIHLLFHNHRDHIENVVAKNMYTEDGAAYSDALKTLLAGVDALPQDRNDSYWISMLKRKSVCKFLLKPTEYMVMTLQTFDEVCDTIINLTQSVNAAVAMPTNAQTTSLVFKQNRGVVEKIEFRYGKFYLYSLQQVRCVFTIPDLRSKDSSGTGRIRIKSLSQIPKGKIDKLIYMVAA